MKIFTIAAILVWASLAGQGLADAPPITFTVQPTEPDENGPLIYAVMGAESGNEPATGRFWAAVKFTNTLGVDLRLNKIRLSFLTGFIPIVRDFPRDKTVIPNATLTDGLIDEGTSGGIDEIVVLNLPAPFAVVVSLYFDTYTDPVSVQRALTPYVPAVPGGRYFFHADEGDLGPGEYFSDSHAHGTDKDTGLGNQHLGADWKVYRLLGGGESSTVRSGGTSSVNADHLGWGIPIRALSDGVVLRTSLGWVNNPTAGTRAFQKLAEDTGEAIQDVKVTRLGPKDSAKPKLADPSRAATLTRLPGGNFQISVWDMANGGRQLTRLGSSLPAESADLVTDIEIDELAEDPQDARITRVVTTFRLTNGNLRAVVWSISSDGQTVGRLGQEDWALGDFSEMSLMKMSATRFATAVRDAAGNLRVAVWEVVGDNPYKRIDDSAGGATSVNITALTGTRLVASMRASDGLLKVIVWDYSARAGPIYTLTRKGEQTGGAISRVVAAKTKHKNEDDVNVVSCVTAARTSPGGLLQVTRWLPAANGQSIAAESQVNGPAILDSALAMCRAAGDNVTTASLLTAGGVFKINLWGTPDFTETPPETTFQFSAQNQDVAVNRISIDEPTSAQFFAATRTPGGNLKIMIWDYANGGGNAVYVLHGNCRVLYAHLQDGSVDANVIKAGAIVGAGQVLGRMGNSGASGAPHTHIHSDRLASVYDIDQMIADEASEDHLPTIGPRPLPFSNARAMRLSEIQPGGETSGLNSFATLNGHGMYDVALGIRPRINTRYVAHSLGNVAPNGLKDSLQTLPPFGGPWPAVGTALTSSPSGTRLYIRGGNYPVNQLFTTPMTIRRYDFYEADGTVTIQR